MSVKRVNISQLPQGRFQNSALSATKEWRDAIKEIKRGLNPSEAVKITLSPETIAALPLKDPVRAFYVGLRRLVQQHKYPVDVLSRANEEGEGGMDIWIVGRAVGGKA